MQRVLGILDNLGDYSGKIISPLLAAVIVILIYEIGMRYIFNAPTNWAHESSQYLFATYALLSGAYTFRHGLHVNMDMVYNRFSPRMKAIVDLFTSLLALCFIVSFLWWGLTALESVQLRRLVTNWGPPLILLR
jgi:TRAP-type C4-dicarboxylate transport system permease small subunit